MSSEKNEGKHSNIVLKKWTLFYKWKENIWGRHHATRSWDSSSTTLLPRITWQQKTKTRKYKYATNSQSWLLNLFPVERRVYPETTWVYWCLFMFVQTLTNVVVLVLLITEQFLFHGWGLARSFAVQLVCLEDTICASFPPTYRLAEPIFTLWYRWRLSL